MQNTSITDKFQILEQRLIDIEARFSELGYSTKTFVQTEMKSKWKIPAQANTMFGIHTAICVETEDPYTTGRIRFFSPLMHDPQTPIKKLPWAYPVSSMGGFDDSGCLWVPPAGSKVCLLFEQGNRQMAYYIGTTWDRDRGKPGQRKWNYNIEEYYEYHEGKRDGYLVGPNDSSQVFPPWNTSNYNVYDIDSIADFEEDPEAQKRITPSNHYGFKTPQKHSWLGVDGNYKCNHRWSRLEMKSGGGGFMIFKDDPHHPAGQWAHPDCGCGSGDGDVSVCSDDNNKALFDADSCDKGEQAKCANPFCKHQSDCRPYKGPGTPQNNRCDDKTLPQTGWQVLSQSGHTLWFDDKVEEPQGVPDWKRGVEPFDFGCTDLFQGKIRLVSATGHSIELNDEEETTKVRSKENKIKLTSATGNFIELNDHTELCDCDGTSNDKKAGDRRGIHMGTTSRHTFDMSDEGNEHCGECRKDGGTPENEATDAFIRLKSGYGLEIMMADYNSQKETESQFIQLFAPQKDSCCGPHIIRMQEDSACGQIFIRSGGDYICMSVGDHYSIVGAGEGDDFCEGGCLGPSDHMLMVSQHSLHYSCKLYYNKAETHFFVADDYIILAAGQDCDDEDGNKDVSPCIYPVMVMRNEQIVASDRVFASASDTTKSCASILNLLPFHRCGTPD